MNINFNFHNVDKEIKDDKISKTEGDVHCLFCNNKTFENFSYAEEEEGLTKGALIVELVCENCNFVHTFRKQSDSDENITIPNRNDLM